MKGNGTKLKQTDSILFIRSNNLAVNKKSLNKKIPYQILTTKGVNKPDSGLLSRFGESEFY